MAPADGNGRIPLLDGMRGVAALAVMGLHVEHVFIFDGPFARAYLFVDFFFLLSGFVLGIAADPKLQSGIGCRTFMRARWIRLWPMIAIGASIGAMAFAKVNGAGTTLVLLGMALAMLPVLIGTSAIFPLNGPQWSLMLELIANLAHSVLFWRLSNREISLLAGMFGAGLLAAIVHEPGNEFGPDVTNWWMALFRVGFAYLVGLRLARSYRAGGLTVGAAIPWYVAVATPVAAIIALPYLPLAKALGDAAVTLAVVPLSFAFATSARFPGALHAIGTGLGRISYPIYAVHLPVLVYVGSHGKDIWHLIAAVTVALGLAAYLAVLLEGPKMASPPRPTAGAASAKTA